MEIPIKMDDLPGTTSLGNIRIFSLNIHRNMHTTKKIN